MMKAEKKDGIVKQINLKVRGPNNEEVEFRVKSTTELKKVFEAYSNKMGVGKGANGFRFQFDGESLNGNQTAESAGLEDGDVINALTQQIGGFGTF